MPAEHLELIALPNIPSIKAGDDIASIILDALTQSEYHLKQGDILVVSSKIISKSEGCFVDLRTITPSEKAEELADKTRKDPRLVELILQESSEISRAAPYVLIVTHRLGFTSANAGIDQSNTGSVSDNIVLLLPKDPDASAKKLAEAISEKTGILPAIVISDTHGRPFRLGNLNVAIGAYGLPVIYDQRGEVDLYGRELEATVTAFADEIAAASGLISGQAAEGQPVVLMRGMMMPDEPHGLASQLNRPKDKDLYR